MVLLLVLLPDSQFLCWSYSVMAAGTCRKRWRKCSIFPWHLGVSYIMPCMCPAEHMVCCQWAAHHIDCAGLFQWTHDSCVVHVFVLFVSYSVAWSLSHILMMVMCMQLCCIRICSPSPHNVCSSCLLPIMLLDLCLVVAPACSVTMSMFTSAASSPWRWGWCWWRMLPWKPAMMARKRYESSYGYVSLYTRIVRCVH